MHDQFMHAPIIGRRFEVPHLARKLLQCFYERVVGPPIRFYHRCSFFTGHLLLLYSLFIFYCSQIFANSILNVFYCVFLALALRPATRQSRTRDTVTSDFCKITLYFIRHLLSAYLEQLACIVSCSVATEMSLKPFGKFGLRVVGG